ncbi:MAG: MurR/RpiR family transcriptional regulator [Gammaproteobacteria bacterium]
MSSKPATMAKTPKDSTLARIREHYDSLPPSERKLADLLLDFPGDVASYTATELAELAGVSKAAVSRFFRRLGYESFEQARLLARDQQHWGSPLYLLTQKPELDVSHSSLKRQMELEMENLAKTYERLDIRALESIAGKLVKAGKIWLFGFRHSHFLAGYARWQMLQIRGDVHQLVSESSTLTEQIADIAADDVIIAIGYRRRTKRFLQTLKTLHARKHRILYLTEPNVGASINYATWVITAEVSGAGTFDSYPAPCSVIHLLCNSMFAQAGKPARQRLESIEELHDELGDF